MLTRSLTASLPESARAWKREAVSLRPQVSECRALLWDLQPQGVFSGCCFPYTAGVPGGATFTLPGESLALILDTCRWALLFSSGSKHLPLLFTKTPECGLILLHTPAQHQSRFPGVGSGEPPGMEASTALTFTSWLLHKTSHGIPCCAHGFWSIHCRTRRYAWDHGKEKEPSFTQLEPLVGRYQNIKVKWILSGLICCLNSCLQLASCLNLLSLHLWFPAMPSYSPFSFLKEKLQAFTFLRSYNFQTVLSVTQPLCSLQQHIH